MLVRFTHKHRNNIRVLWFDICEYQCSLRDWVELVTRRGEMLIVGGNALSYKTNYDEMQATFDIIKRFAHINKEQFVERFKYREETSVIPVRPYIVI